MALVEQLRRMVRWDRWANSLVLAALRESGGQPPAALAAFQHVLEAEITWLRRIDGAPGASVDLWGEASIGQCEAWAGEAGLRISALADSLDEDRLAGTFTYRNSAGREFTDRVEEPLLHVLLHSSQYRGEAAAFLNAAGRRVPDMDFIFWLRMGEPA